MNQKINSREPLFGFYSVCRNSYTENCQECLEVMQCISLEKFGNDNLNFAAVLINGHHNRNIVDNLLINIKAEFNSVAFSKLSEPMEFMEYIKGIFAKYEQNFLVGMSNLHKKKDELVNKLSCKSDNEQAEIMMQIYKMENELKSGATVAIAALIKGNLYIFNIGDNKIILVANDVTCDDSIDTLQFLLQTDEASFHNEKEISRIQDECGLNPDALRWLSMLSQERCHSRCIGDYDLKINYRNYDCLTDALSSPLISTPQNEKCIHLESNYTHILLVSSGLFYLVREYTYDTDKIHGEISRKFFEIKEQNSQDSLKEICKKVLEFFVEEQKTCHKQYEDIMGINCELMEYTQHGDLSLFAIDISVHLSDSHVTKEDSNGFEIVEKISSNVPSTNDSLDSLNTRDSITNFKLGANLPITAYVDFTEWDRAMNKLTPAELKKIDLITNIDDLFVTPIVEESESMVTSRSTTIDENKSPELSDLSNISPRYQGIPTNSELK